MWTTGAEVSGSSSATFSGACLAGSWTATGAAGTHTGAQMGCCVGLAVGVWSCKVTSAPDCYYGHRISFTFTGTGGAAHNTLSHLTFSVSMLHLTFSNTIYSKSSWTPSGMGFLLELHILQSNFLNQWGLAASEHTPNPSVDLGSKLTWQKLHSAWVQLSIYSAASPCLTSSSGLWAHYDFLPAKASNGFPHCQIHVISESSNSVAT